MTLASDLYDPDTGLDRNPDAGLYVEFYEKKDSDPPGQIYCKIIVPGDKTFAHDQPVRDHDKARFPRHWLAFQMRSDTEQPATAFGTPLDQWVMDQPGVINENQRVELFALGFRTVEQVAMATDAQVQRMGLGALGMREGARTYLRSKSRGDADGKMVEMEARMAEMAALIEKLSNPTAVAIRRAVADVVPLDPTIPPPPRKVRGPNKIKRKAPQRTRHVEHAAATGDASHQ